MNYEFDLSKENSEKVMIDKVGHFNKSKYASVHILTLGYNSPRLAA